MSTEKPMTKVLIFGGKTGWIGGKMHDLCKEKGAWPASALENNFGSQSFARGFGFGWRRKCCTLPFPFCGEEEKLEFDLVVSLDCVLHRRKKQHFKSSTSIFLVKYFHD